eukprot:TRINITY_DN7748_c0_g1_i3.p1 TRINITY_DN7748_c0_g1~~TRINITY_DN7748_c0_g1_i3.p1  ORF type:complete len:148 (+),score=16.51 TRINITY_DN7748_c0_g1_i3:589-1032(+)
MGAELEYNKEYSCAMEAYEKGMEILSGRYTKDNHVYHSLLKAAKDLKERQLRLLSYHTKCAKNRLLGTTKRLYANNVYAHNDAMVSHYIKSESVQRRTRTSFASTTKATIFKEFSGFSPYSELERKESVFDSNRRSNVKTPDNRLVW